MSPFDLPKSIFPFSVETAELIAFKRLCHALGQWRATAWHTMSTMNLNKMTVWSLFPTSGRNFIWLTSTTCVEIKSITDEEFYSSYLVRSLMCRNKARTTVVSNNLWSYDVVVQNNDSSVIHDPLIMSSKWNAFIDAHLVLLPADCTISGISS